MKKQQGITLIALVITIIVLLILAGVTIAAITSNESAPNKAVQARDENERGAAKDAATLLVAEKIQAYYEAKYVNRTTNEATVGGYVNAELATAVVRGEHTIQVVGGKLQVTRTSDSKELAKGTINPDGTITWDATPGENGGGEEQGTPATAEELNSLIGTTVYYSGYSASYAGDWQVFYATDTEMFITSKNVVNRINVNQCNSEYLGSESLSNMPYGTTWNEDWLQLFENRGYHTQSPNAKATAYLCDSNKWSDYVSSLAPAGTYAVGGPTLSLFKKSYDQWCSNNNKTGTVIPIRPNYIGYRGFDQDDGGPVSLVEGYNLYQGCLASPVYVSGSGNDNRVIVVYSNLMEQGFENKISPLVSIPMNSVRINGNTVSILGITEKSLIQANKMEVLNDNEITNNNLKNNSYIKEVLTGQVPVPVGYTYKKGTSTTESLTNEDINNGLSYGVVVTDENGNEWVWVPVNENESVAPESIYETAEGIKVGTNNEDNNKLEIAKSINGLKIASITEFPSLKVADDDSSSSEESGPTFLTDVTANKCGASEIINNIYRYTPDDMYYYREPALVTDWDGNYYQQAGFDSIGDMAHAFVDDYDAMIESIITYGGFYVGRYELSGTNNGSDHEIINAKVQAGQAPMDGVNWYRLYHACRTFGTETTTSTMIWGTQWDLVCNWTQKVGDQVSYSNYQSNRHSGNYSATTGSNINDIRNNVCDLEGSRYEWTQEASSTSNRAYRGGNYGNYSNVGANDRNDNGPADSSFGVRVSCHTLHKC